MDDGTLKNERVWMASMDRVTVRHHRRFGLKGGAMGALLLAAVAMLPTRSARALHDAPILVTLITGDQVVLVEQGTEVASIRRAPGRDGVGFIVQSVSSPSGGSPHLVVIPEDALPLLAAGKVDPRLFDVTQLIDYGYDDGHRGDVPLIVTYAPGTAQQFASSPRAVVGAVVKGSLPPVNGVSVSATKAQVHELWGSVSARPGPGAQTGSGASARAGTGASAQTGTSDAVARIWLDGLLRPTLDRSAAQIGAPRAWELGYEGDGVVVALLDSGVDDTHPDLVDKIIVSRNFTASVDDDQSGHGTHVASVIVGSGAASGGLYRGIAPGAQLLSGKVCGLRDCPESSIIAGLHWAAAEEGARIVNMSFGDIDRPGFDPVEEAVSLLAAQYGTLFVVAGGNSGPDPSTITRPANLSAVLTVGAIDPEGRVAAFSSRGMTVGELLLKPDVTAPGVGIMGALAAGAPEGTGVDEFYARIGGTSNAAPHVTGAAALLFQRHPDWAAADVKAALMGTAAFNPADSALAQGAGRVDIPAALEASLLASTPSLSFGVFPWPHELEEPRTRTVSYRNLGAATELALELDVLGPDGQPAPAEMWAVTPSSVTLPEGGTASVRVSVSTRTASLDGVYSGRLMASDATGRSLAIPLAVEREVESYDLSLRHLDRSGAPTANWRVLLYSYATSNARVIDHRGVTAIEDVTLRLPSGERHALEAFVYEADSSAPLTHFLAPNVELDGDQILLLDASAAAPVRVVAPTPNAVHQSLRAIWTISSMPFGISSRLNYDSVGDVAFYQAEIGTAAPELEALLTAQWLDSSTSPPTFYAGARMGQGRLPAGPALVNLQEAAVVDATYAAPGTTWPPLSELRVAAFPGSRLFDHAEPRIAVELPHRRTEYYDSDGGRVRWVNGVSMRDAAFTQSITLGDEPHGYEPGQSYTTHWNQPPFSPALPEGQRHSERAYREGDTLVIEPSLYADREGHSGSVFEERVMVLYRNGELVDPAFGDLTRVDVPPEPASYRVELESRQSTFELTPRQTAAWTFESARVAEGTERLPLLVVRFTPELSERGRAPGGVSFTLPFHVDPYGRTTPPPVIEPSVEVSYDDGASWLRAPVTADASGWVAQLEHPSGAGYVSLRTSTQDLAGNTVEQTLYRAYGLESEP